MIFCAIFCTVQTVPEKNLIFLSLTRTKSHITEIALLGRFKLVPRCGLIFMVFFLSDRLTKRPFSFSFVDNNNVTNFDSGLNRLKKKRIGHLWESTPFNGIRIDATNGNDSYSFEVEMTHPLKSNYS